MISHPKCTDDLCLGATSSQQYSCEYCGNHYFHLPRFPVTSLTNLTVGKPNPVTPRPLSFLCNSYQLHDTVLVTIRQLSEWCKEPSKTPERMVEFAVRLLHHVFCTQKIHSLVMIVTVNVGTAAWFLMPGFFTKIGSCWSRKGDNLSVQLSYTCKTEFV